MRKWLKKHLVNILLFIIMMAGIGLMAYPTFANWWNSLSQVRAINTYVATVSNLSKEEYDRIISSAEDYNTKLAQTGNLWAMTKEQEARYEHELNIGGEGIMGYIDIPKVNVRLPIYHGTNEKVLQIAIGHLEGTSLPVGGETSHCVVTGHRGLPSARLFTDIDKIVEGDTWTLTILDRTLTYECDQIRVVEPFDCSELSLVEGMDYCTLVTCTPYGVNTHRLLVRGHRIANASGEANVIADAIMIESVYIAPFIAVPMLIVLIFEMLIMTGRRRRKNAAMAMLKSETEHQHLKREPNKVPKKRRKKN